MERAEVPSMIREQRLSRWIEEYLSLCRDPHVLLDADAELDLNLIFVLDLDAIHQSGSDNEAPVT